MSSVHSQKCLTGRESKAKLHFIQFRVVLQTTGHARSLVEATSDAHKLHQDQVYCNIQQYCNFLHLQHVLMALTGTVDAL